MAKQKKKAAELAEMIKQRINIGGAHVVVHPHANAYWTATVIAAPGKATNVQAAVDQIAAELRQDYEVDG